MDSTTPVSYTHLIEKASANLVTFGKTDSIEPGASQTLTLTFNTEDMEMCIRDRPQAEQHHFGLLGQGYSLGLFGGIRFALAVKAGYKEFDFICCLGSGRCLLC